MAFNADTYYANQHAKKAKENLSMAREIKARAAAGDAYDWEIPRIAYYARLARIDARLARGWRALKGKGK